jgi:hypothetical protein
MPEACESLLGRLLSPYVLLNQDVEKRLRGHTVASGCDTEPFSKGLLHSKIYHGRLEPHIESDLMGPTPMISKIMGVQYSPISA